MPKPIRTRSGFCWSTFSCKRCRPCTVASPPVAPLVVSILARGYFTRSAAAQRSQKISAGLRGVAAGCDAVPKRHDAHLLAGCQLLPRLGQPRHAELGVRRRTLPLLPMRIIHIDKEPPVAKPGELVMAKVLFAVEHVGAEVGDARARCPPDLSRCVQQVILPRLVMNGLRQPVPIRAADGDGFGKQRRKGQVRRLLSHQHDRLAGLALRRRVRAVIGAAIHNQRHRQTRQRAQPSAIPHPSVMPGFDPNRNRFIARQGRRPRLPVSRAFRPAIL